jgi:hypothetical protein
MLTARKKTKAARAAVFIVAMATCLGTGCAHTPSSETSDPGDAGPPPTADELLRAVAICNPVSTGGYKTDDQPSAPANISICGLPGVVYWKADMDIDCDGKTTAVCNLQRDPWYQPQSSATDSKGQFVDASTLPFVVVPLPSARFNYAAAGLGLGSVVAVVYNGKVAYGPFADEGPENIIGEASYAMAVLLGIDPDPATGGTADEVTYVAFTGATGLVKPLEDHAAAKRLGQRLAAELVAR